jgi:hypothetical protein
MTLEVGSFGSTSSASRRLETRHPPMVLLSSFKGTSSSVMKSSAGSESDVLKKTPADDLYGAIENHEPLQKLDPFML